MLKALERYVLIAIVFVGVAFLGGCLSTTTSLSEADMTLIEGAVDRAVSEANEYTDQRLADQIPTPPVVTASEPEETFPPTEVVKREKGIVYLGVIRSGNVTDASERELSGRHALLLENRREVRTSSPSTTGLAGLWERESGVTLLLENKRQAIVSPAPGLVGIWGRESGVTHIEKLQKGNVTDATERELSGRHALLLENKRQVVTSPSPGLTSLWEREKGVTHIEEIRQGNVTDATERELSGRHALLLENRREVRTSSPSTTGLAGLWERESGVTHIEKLQKGNVTDATERELRGRHALFLENKREVNASNTTSLETEEE
jgi:hypothetical protein